MLLLSFARECVRVGFFDDSANRWDTGFGIILRVEGSAGIRELIGKWDHSILVQ